MWQNGFSNIERFARDRKRTRVQNSGAMGMKRMFWKKNCQEAFNRWRKSGFTTVKVSTKMVINVRETAIEKHESFVDRTKVWTGVKG